MKKLLLLLITIIPVILFAQIEMGIGAGIDTKTVKPIANTYIGFRVSQFSLNAEIRPSITRTANVHNYVGGKVGVDLSDRSQNNASVIIGAGEYYDIRSQDKTQLNSFKTAFFAKGIWYLKEYNGLYIETFYINKSVQLSFGMHVTLN